MNVIIFLLFFSLVTSKVCRQNEPCSYQIIDTKQLIPAFCFCADLKKCFAYTMENKNVFIFKCQLSKTTTTTSTTTKKSKIEEEKRC